MDRGREGRVTPHPVAEAQKGGEKCQTFLIWQDGRGRNDQDADKLRQFRRQALQLRL